jgi:hypothetical protein
MVEWIGDYGKVYFIVTQDGSTGYLTSSHGLLIEIDLRVPQIIGNITVRVNDDNSQFNRCQDEVYLVSTNKGSTVMNVNTREITTILFPIGLTIRCDQNIPNIIYARHGMFACC